jgi:hypothetical protein
LQEFRELSKEISTILAYEAMKDLPTTARSCAPRNGSNPCVVDAECVPAWGWGGASGVLDRGEE